MKIQISFDLNDLDSAIEVAHKVKDYCDIMEVGAILIHKYGIQAVKEFVSKFPDMTIMADTKIVDRGKEITEIYAKSGVKWISVMAGTSNTVIHRVCSETQKNDILVMLDTLDSVMPGQVALDAKNLGVDAILFHKAHDYFMSQDYKAHEHKHAHDTSKSQQVVTEIGKNSGEVGKNGSEVSIDGGQVGKNVRQENGAKERGEQENDAREKGAGKALLFLDEIDMIKENTTLPIFISAHINRENIDKIIAAKPYGIIIGKSITEAKDPASEAEFYYNLCKAGK